MAKIHMYHYETEIGMPLDIKLEYRKDGLNGALCGYMRKTTTDPKKVTCFYCKKIMEREHG